jgi:WD40 repeat protein
LRIFVFAAAYYFWQKQNSMHKYLSALLLCCHVALAQPSQDYKFLNFDNKYLINSVALAPDGATLVISTSQGPLFFYDWQNEQVVSTVDRSTFAGPKVSYSADGKYVLLQRQYFVDFALNKDRPAQAEVMDAGSGKVVFEKSGVHSACITNENKFAMLSGNEISVWNLSSGAKEISFEVPDATNAIAVSPDGKTVAVSFKPTAADIKDVPSIRDDKKAQKEALKFRQMVAFYDLATQKRTYVTNDVFDIVYSMTYSRDGKSLWIYNVPHQKLQMSSAGRQGYINKINALNGDVGRTILMSLATEPEYRESDNGEWMGVISIETTWGATDVLLVYETLNGRLMKNFRMDKKLFETGGSGRTSFAFLPDGERVIIGYGNKLALWKMPK